MTKIVNLTKQITDDNMHEFRDTHLYAKPLSEREKQIIELMAKGLSSKDIMIELGIAHSTVRNTQNTIYSKLNVGSALEVVAAYYLGELPEMKPTLLIEKITNNLL